MQPYFLSTNLLLSVISYGTTIFASVQNDEYVKDYICNTDELDNVGCITQYTDSLALRYKSNCAMQCSRTENCLGFMWTSNISCQFHINPCTVNTTTCSVNESGDVYYKRTVFGMFSCGPNGTWDADNQRCSCSGGFIGNLCEHYAESCADLRTWGYPNCMRTPFYIQPPGFDSPSIVLCSIASTETRTFIAASEADGFNFDRTWNDYKTGFYTNDGETYWIGLDFLQHFIATKGITNARILYLLAGASIIYKYQHLEMRGENESYAIYGKLGSMNAYQDRAIAAVTTEEHNITDGCFSTILDTFTPFSTPDVDNDDELDLSCANQSRTGWWFSKCTPHAVCTPLGIEYSSANETVFPYHINAPYIDARSIYDVFIRVLMFLVEYV